MRDRNIFFDLQNKVDEIKRREHLFDRVDKINFSEFDRAQNLINELNRTSRGDLQNPLNGFGNSVNDLNKHFKFIEDLSQAENSISKSVFNNLQSFQNPTIQNARRLIDEAFSPFSKSNLINERILRDFNQLRENLLSPFHSRNSDLLRDIEKVTRATTLSSFEALSKSIVETKLLKNENLLRQVSDSLLSYDRFANNTLAKLRLETDKSVASALAGSLTLANEQMLRSTNLMQTYIENSDASRLESSNLFYGTDLIKANRFRVQKQELLQRDDIGEYEEYESLVTKSPSATIFEQIVECMVLIGECNEASETITGAPIFKITTSFWNSAWSLQRLIATNKDNLERVVLCLYQIIYEGAGEDNLRFLEYVNKDEANVVFVLKHFRNKWLIHDVDHGKDSKIQKSFKERREALEWLGMTKTPTKMDDFVTLNSYLLIKLKEFLQLLLERVSVFPKE